MPTRLARFVGQEASIGLISGISSALILEMKLHMVRYLVLFQGMLFLIDSRRLGHFMHTRIPVNICLHSIGQCSIKAHWYLHWRFPNLLTRSLFKSAPKSLIDILHYISCQLVCHGVSRYCGINKALFLSRIWKGVQWKNKLIQHQSCTALTVEAALFQ